ncbi:YaiI/YqxD family protein [Vaginisenegalia massiliensis]|uniref:YaiI/YqxD family protein n=1 Tax=Vaginisenegalia massiliensis TaxID=2058294 RepID=UPI000F530A0F|nr:YaiI/YqxD family protein [Vaginisenegalia massiliensis]
MDIYIDGDGSPVKDRVISIANDYGLKVKIVTSIDHYTHKVYPDYVQIVYVDKGQEMADYRLFALIKVGDILVTQDYGLASLVLDKALVIHHTGMIYNKNNIEALLFQRAQAKQMRQAGIRTKGPKPFSARQQAEFDLALRRLIESTIES